LTLTRLRLGYIIGFIIAVLLVGLGVYSVYYFFTFAHERSNYLFGGLGIPVFGYVLIRATYPVDKNLRYILICLTNQLTTRNLGLKA
jgi:hypothetical protein